MRALVIPADLDEPIREVALGADTLRALQTLVDGLIDAVAYPDRSDVTTYVNDEGKYLGLDPNLRATRLLAPVLFHGDWIAGDLVIAGFDPNSGETVPLPGDITATSLA